MKPRIAVIDGGTYYHHRALFGERYRSYFAEVIYIRDLWNTPLAHFDAVVFPDRLHPGPLVAARRQIAEYLDTGGTVAAFGESQSHTWLPGLAWSPRPTNFWWWKTPGARLPLYAATPEHSLFRHLTIHEATWHVHGVFTPPSGTTPLIGLEGDGALLYEDTVTTPGRMVISSLDPFYHYGSYFMPVTERFLHGFLEWLAASCSGPRASP